MLRREFIKAGLGAGLAIGAGAGLTQKVLGAAGQRVRALSEPAAIAMWDFSWLLRHHPAGEFEDWDAALDGLVERGYNAVRIDMFPHLVAAKPDGSHMDEYFFPKGDWKPAMWGNKFSVRVRPREGVLDFLRKCRDRGVMVGYSTWFFGPGVEQIEGLDGFVRVWEETLALVEQNGLLDTCLYVDLLNEYPLFHGFSWLTNKLNSMKSNPPAPDDRQAHEWRATMGAFTQEGVDYYRQFGSEAIRRLKKRWPDLDYMLCQTFNGDANWEVMDYSEYDVMDVHYWFIMNDKLGAGTGYWENIHGLADNDLQFRSLYGKLRENWDKNKPELTAWMDDNMAKVAAKARQRGIPCGNTEGWGIINWLDHPDLPWDIIKEAAEICARLGQKHNYAFNCTSNFTHPTFPGYWRDVEWHKRVTSIIRKGNV